MSSVFMHIGQCGIQVGREFWNQIDNSCTDFTYKNNDGYRRSILVDSEPKVVRSITNLSSDSIRCENIIYGHHGYANNWTYGYTGSTDGDLLDKTMNSLRKEIERCDSFLGLFVFHSLCGGTGSGFTSRFCELYRDNFPLEYLICCPIFAHQSGESCVQNYNSILCIEKLQNLSDGIFWFSNDLLLNQLKSNNLNKNSVTSVEMNSVIAENVNQILMPIDSISRHKISIGREPWEALQTLCPMPSHKFFHSYSFQESRLSWDQMNSKLINKIIKINDIEARVSTLSSLYIARGDRLNTFPSNCDKITEKLKRGINPVEWNPFYVDYWTSVDNLTDTSKRRDNASVALFLNDTLIVDFLKKILFSSKKMFDAGAYLHKYIQNGIDSDLFTQAFSTVDSIIDSYNCMTLN